MANIPDLFGVDLGNSGIKVCEIKGKDGKMEISKVGLVASENDLSSLNQSDDMLNTLAETIKVLTKKAGIKTKNCVMALPETLVFSRLLTLPKMKDDEVNEAIHWAAKPVVPTALEELNLSYLSVDSFKKGSKEFVNWYLVAAPKDLVLRYQNLMKKAGYNLLALETESLAVTRYISTNYKLSNEDVLILDIGADNSNIIIAKNGVVVFSQTLNTGGIAISKVIASEYGLDETQADKYKITFGLDFQSGDGKIAKTIVPVIDVIVNELSRTLTYHKEKIKGGTISKVYLTGGGAGLIKLDEYIKQKLSIEAIKPEPNTHIPLAKKLRKSHKIEHMNSFNVAIGLALKGYI